MKNTEMVDAIDQVFGIPEQVKSAKKKLKKKVGDSGDKLAISDLNVGEFLDIPIGVSDTNQLAEAPIKIKTKEKKELVMLGRVEWFDDRFYKFVNLENQIEYFPSVTTILGAIPKPFLAKWRGDIGNREADLRSDESKNKGNRIHFACSEFWKNTPIIYSKNPTDEPGVILRDQDEMVQVWRFAKFVEQLKIEPIVDEYNIISIQNKYAGTIDLVCKIPTQKYLDTNLEEGIYILDIKTGSSVSDDYKLQISAYAKAYAEIFQTEIAGAIILHLNSATKKGIEGLKIIHLNKDEINQCFSDFLDVYKVWKSLNKNIEPKKFEFPERIIRYA